MSKKHIGSTLSSFLDEMKIREETELLAFTKTLTLLLPDQPSLRRLR